MATAGSLVINVAADASKLEEGFARARSASKTFVQQTQADLKSMVKQNRAAEKVQQMVEGLGTGGFAGLIAGSIVGGGVGSVIGSIVGQLDQASGFSDLIKRDWEMGGKYLLDILGIQKDNTKALEMQANLAEQNADAHKRAQKYIEESNALAREWQRLEFGAKQVEQWEAGANAERVKSNQMMRERNELEKEFRRMQKAADQAGMSDREKAIDDFKRQFPDGNQRRFEKLFDELAAKDEAAAQLQRDIQEAAQRAKAENEAERLAKEMMPSRVLAEMDRQDQAARMAVGPVGALRAGSAEAYSAEQKAKRIVEAQGEGGRLGDPAERAVKIQEQIKREEEKANKKLEDIKKALDENAKLKVFKL